MNFVSVKQRWGLGGWCSGSEKMYKEIVLTAVGRIEVILQENSLVGFVLVHQGSNFCGGALGIIIKISKRRKRGWRRALRTVILVDIDCIYFKMENFMFC